MMALAILVEKAHPELCEKDKKNVFDNTDVFNEEELQKLAEKAFPYMVFPENYNEDFLNKVLFPALISNPELMDEIKHMAEEMSKETGENLIMCLANIVYKDPAIPDKLVKILRPYYKSNEELKNLRKDLVLTFLKCSSVGYGKLRPHLDVSSRVNSRRFITAPRAIGKASPRLKNWLKLQRSLKTTQKGGSSGRHFGRFIFQRRDAFLGRSSMFSPPTRCNKLTFFFCRMTNSPASAKFTSTR